MRSSRAPFNLSALKLALVKCTGVEAGVEAGPQTDAEKRPTRPTRPKQPKQPKQRSKRRIPDSSSSDDWEDDVPLTNMVAAAEEEAAAARAAAARAAARAAAAEEAAAARAAAAKAAAAKAVSAAVRAAAVRAAAARAAEAEPAPPPGRPQRKGAGEGVCRMVPDFGRASQLAPTVAEVRGHSTDEVSCTRTEWENNPFFRADLEVKTSTVCYQKGKKKGQLVGQDGLFTKTDIPSGEWVGFYAGHPWTKRKWEKLLRPQQNKYSRYAAEAETKQNWVMMVPPYKEDGTLEPDFDQFPLSSINEPDAMQTANVFTLASQLQLDFPAEYGDYEKEPHEFFIISMFVGRDVHAGEELLWHYGEGYDGARRVNGGYTPGLACPAPPKNEHDAYADKALIRAANLTKMIPNINIVRKMLHDSENK